MFEMANYLEAVLWGGFAIVCFIAAARTTGITRRCSAVAGLTLLAFGGSDVVEVSTGAWWRPWWLFAWKALCLVVLGRCLMLYLRNRGRGGRF